MEILTKDEATVYADRRKIELGSKAKYISEYIYENQVYIAEDGVLSRDSYYNPNSDVDSNDENHPNNDYPDTPSDSWGDDYGYKGKESFDSDISADENSEDRKEIDRRRFADPWYGLDLDRGKMEQEGKGIGISDFYYN